MDAKIFEEMWDRKAAYREVFATAILNRDTEAVEYVQRGPDRANTKMRTYTLKAGTKVIITMLSRFGDVGIRNYAIHDRTHGYIARVNPDALDDVKFLPERT